MKKIIFLVLIMVGTVCSIFAQQVPAGMKYQAVARDVKGQVLANSKIELKINLLAKTDGKEFTSYSEQHAVITNQLGLFSLVVGAGTMLSGQFDKVPWATSDIWMEIQIKTSDQAGFTAISNSQLLAVPYAYHAATAGQLVAAVTTTTNQQRGLENEACPCDGDLSQIKLLYQDGPASPVTILVYDNKNLHSNHLIASFTNVSNGNILTLNATANNGKLKKEHYFKIQSSSVPAVEIPTGCEEYEKPWQTALGKTFGNFSVLSHNDKNNSECTLCAIATEWHVGGNGLLADFCNRMGTKSNSDLVFITNNQERMNITKAGVLNVLNAVNLNTQTGNTINNGDFTVANTKSTLLSGTLLVNGSTQLANTLLVVGATQLNNTLSVDGVATLNNTTQSSAKDNGAMVVEGGAGIEKNLNVGGNVNIGGSATFGGSADFNGVINITDATQSTAVNNGALIVAGGVGIGKNVNIGGNTAMTGGLTINELTESNASGNGALIVAGGVGIGKNLNIGGNTALTGKFSVIDNTQSTAVNNGASVVSGGVGIGKNLNVGGDAAIAGGLSITSTTQSTAVNNGAFVIAGGMGIAKNVNIGGNTSMLGTLNIVDALSVTGATSLANTLVVGGLTKINNRFEVSSNVAQGDYVATFNNTNNGTGDGIKIKLGKAKSIYSPPTIPPLLTAAEMDQIRNLIRCDFTGSRIDILGDLAISGALDNLKVIGGIAVGAGNLIINGINGLLGLPIKIGPLNIPSLDVPALNIPSFEILPYITVFPEINLEPIATIGPYGFGPVNFPAVNVTPPIHLFGPVTLLPEIEVMPRLPEINLSTLGIDGINLTDLSFWGIPTDLCLSDAPGSSPMNNSNEFIRFTDKNDAKMGSIRAVSVADWAANYLNPMFLFKLKGAITSSTVDKFHAKYHFKNEISAALTDYVKIGVEYTSGNGDYAEWLKRIDETELINAGDIVGVIGGKITKDLAKAEQVMVASKNPIVLGNMPAEGMNYLGNNIAFMGQVPVKILGPVSTGDYIVGQSNTPGYGLAKHPKDMTIEDFKYAVGRAWEDIEGDEPKMVNTIVGIHNGDYIKILKNFETKFSETENKMKEVDQRMKKLETQMGRIITTTISQNTTVTNKLKQ